MIPSATYRLQLSPAQDFAAARALVGYLDALGVGAADARALNAVAVVSVPRSSLAFDVFHALAFDAFHALAFAALGVGAVDARAFNPVAVARFAVAFAPRLCSCSSCSLRSRSTRLRSPGSRSCLTRAHSTPSGLSCVQRTRVRPP